MGIAQLVNKYLAQLAIVTIVLCATGYAAHAQQGTFIEASFTVIFTPTAATAEECGNAGKTPQIIDAFTNAQVVWTGNKFVCTKTTYNGYSTLEGTVSVAWTNPYPQSISITNLKYKSAWSDGPAAWQQNDEELVFNSITLPYDSKVGSSYNYYVSKSGDAVKQAISPTFKCIEPGWGTMNCTGGEITSTSANSLIMRITLQYPAGSTTTIMGGTTTTVGGTTTTSIGGTSTSSSTTTSLPLMVTAVTPAKGARGVDYENPGITVQFNQAVDPKTVNANTCKIRYVCCPYKTINGTFAPSAGDASRVTFTPASASGITGGGWNIQVTVRGGLGGVRSKAGDRLAKDYTWTFSTTPDLTVEIVPVQVIDGMDLVQNKEAVIRVKASWSGDLTEVPAKVKLDYEDAAYTIENESAVFYSDTEAAKHEEFQRRGNSINFYSRDGNVPIIKTAGTHTVKATVEPTGQTKIPARKSQATASVKVRPEKTFRVIYYPVNSRVTSNMWNDFDTVFSGSLFGSLLGNSDRLMGKLYPVSSASSRLRTSTIYNFIPYVPEPADPNSIAGIVQKNLHLKSILFHLANLNRLGGYDAVVGIVPREWLDRLLGAVGNSQNIFPAMLTTYSCLMAHDTKPSVVPHEIGHIYLQKNIPNCDDEGHDPRNVTFTGYDLARDRYVTGRNAGWTARAGRYSSTLMDTFIDGADLWDVWMSKDSYQLLLNGLTTAARAPGLQVEQAQAAATQVVQVMGHIYTDAQGAEKAELQPLYVVNNATATAPVPGGQYAVELQNSAGTALKTCTFSPELQEIKDGTSHDLFFIKIENSTSATQLVVRHGSTVLATVKRSASAPVVAITAPTAGQQVTGSKATFSWTATDADGGTMAYDVLYSSDGGATWDILEQNATQTSLDVDTTALTGGSTSKIKVVANDGFNTTEAVSPAFTVRNAPTVLGTSPASGDTDVSPEASISVVFRDPMDAATLTAAAVGLKAGSGGTAVQGEILYNDDTRELLFIPGEILDAKTQYSFTMTTAVKNAQGLALAANYTFSYTTGQQTQSGACPAATALGENAPDLEKLRQLRDSRLAQSALGRKLIEIYYNNAESINGALEDSPALRAAAKGMLEAIASVAGE